MCYYLTENIDFEKHNEEIKTLWSSYQDRKHDRVPVCINGSIRNIFSNPELNKTGFSFQDYFEKAEAQIACQLEYQYYFRHHVLCDREMGLPEDGWQLNIDFQNSYDQAWFGCPFLYFEHGDVPDTEEILKENPDVLYDWEEPDPFWGRGDFMEHVCEIHEEMTKICNSGYEFHGKPVLAPKTLPGHGTDGLFTVALKLRGTVECMCDMYEKPEYFHDLMDYITKHTINRMKAMRKWHWEQTNTPKEEQIYRTHLNFSDDSIAMLSQDNYKEFVFPYHQRIFAELNDGNGCDIHLCGDATHHFRFLADQFNVKCFDTGFPVNHGALRQELGPDIQINGGPSIMLVKDGTPEAIRNECRKICESGVMDGKKFILIAANNLAPFTPIENILALYHAGKEFGRYT